MLLQQEVGGGGGVERRQVGRSACYTLAEMFHAFIIYMVW